MRRGQSIPISRFSHHYRGPARRQRARTIADRSADRQTDRPAYDATDHPRRVTAWTARTNIVTTAGHDNAAFLTILPTTAPVVCNQSLLKITGVEKTLQ